MLLAFGVTCGAMLPPEPDRSRAAELLTEVRIPKKSDESRGEAAFLSLSARRIRREKEADEQRRRQRQRWEQLSQDRNESQTGASGASGAFWKRHNFGRSTCRMFAHHLAQSDPMSIESSTVCREIARRAPAHANDAVKVILEPSDIPPCVLPNGETCRRPASGEEISFDWNDPFTMAYNAMASTCRGEKWQHRRKLSEEAEAAKPEMTFGFDAEDLSLLKDSEKLEGCAGGGVNLARHIFAKEKRSAAECLPWAAQAKATAFEMPKEVALHLAVAFAESSKEASESCESILIDAAMALMSSAAARARDSDDFSFPLQGLEALAQTGLAWKAFSNMFLAAFFSQLQRPGLLSPAVANRLATVFIWAHSNHADLHLHLSPAGRRVAQAACEALHGSNGTDLQTFTVLQALSVRDTTSQSRAS